MTYEEQKLKGLVVLEAAAEEATKDDSVVVITSRRYNEMTGVLGDKEQRMVRRSEIVRQIQRTVEDLSDLEALLADIDAAAPLAKEDVTK